MAERPVALEGRNLGLSLTLGVLWIAVLIVFAGPGRSLIAEARRSFEVREAQSREWENEFSDVHALSETERREWHEGYAQLGEFGAPGDDELELTTWVAAALRAPTLRGLEVRRDPERDDREEIELTSPDGARIALKPVFVGVHFESNYADLSELLSRIEDPSSALELRRIEVKRHQLAVRVRLELDLWTRREIES